MSAPTVASSDSERLGTGPSYQGRCPLRWCPGESLAIDDAPEQVLAAIAVVEEAGVVKNEDNDPVLAELQNLDARLRVLMDLVFHLYRQQSEPAAPQAFVMSATALSIAGAGPAPAMGQTGVVELQLDAPVPRPLRLPAEVTEVSPSEAGWSASLRLIIRNEVLAEALERHVFRHHRREVAGVRRALTEL